MNTDKPTFDPELAVPCKPTRHEPTGRTYCFVQGEHFFSATRQLVRVEPAPAEPAPNEPASE